jgi:hypothetical protein
MRPRIFSPTRTAHLGHMIRCDSLPFAFFQAPALAWYLSIMTDRAA